jgi:hypothetical protein
MASTAQKLPPLFLTQTFATQYPGIHVKKWERTKNGYAAVFRHDKEKQEAFYTQSGKWLSTETKIKWTRKLPNSVRNAWLKSGYSSWQIMGIQKRQTPEQTLYMIHVGELESLGPDDAKIGREYLLYFSPTGQLTRKQLLAEL